MHRLRFAENWQLPFVVAVCLAISAQTKITFQGHDYILSDFFVLFFAIYLNRRIAFYGVLIYLFLACCGAPILADSRGGLLSVIGYSMGYLLGFVLTSWWLGFINYVEKSLVQWSLILIISFLLILSLGSLWLSFSNNLSLEESYYLGFKPFIFSASIKIMAVILLAKILRMKN